METSLEFTAMDATHLAGGLRMSQDTGWPHRIEDWDFVWSMSQGVVALDGDKVVATALATLFGDIAMVNLIIVDSDYRGRGLGRQIVDHAMAPHTPPVWQLVATKEGLPLYEKLGFRATSEIAQHQGLVKPIVPTGHPIWADPGDLDAIRRMDANATGMERTALFDRLATDARFAVLRNDGTITGFAAVRVFGRGEVIGPVAARSLEEAQSLISLILSEREGHFVRVDTDIKTGLAPWLAKYGLDHAGGGIEMQLGAKPTTSTGPQTVFALVSQALG